MNKKISIVIPVFNAGSTIGSSLKSVLDLDYPNKEIIVVFDKRTNDNSLNVIKNFGNKKLKIIFCRPSPPSVARNIGLKKSSGDFVMFVDADTIYPTDFLKIILESFDDKSVGGAVGIKRIMNKGRNVYVKSKALDMEIRAVEGAKPFVAWIFRKDVLNKVGGYDEKIFYFGEDVELAARLKKFGYKITLNADAVWYEIERSALTEDLKRYYRRGVSFALSKYPKFMTKFYYKTLLGSLYYSLLLFALPFLALLKMDFLTSIIAFGFYLPFIFIVLRYALLGVSRTGDFLVPSLYKITGVLRGAALFLGFLAGKITRKFI